MPSVFSYVVRVDSGFAPNPLFDVCTLATCKPRIRNTAQVGDWILGTGSKTHGRGGCGVYCMRVTEAMSFEEYWADPRFTCKRPVFAGGRKERQGDNIYFRAADEDDWFQAPSRHSHEDGSPNERHIERDTRSNRVLISDDFIYWGGTGPEIPEFAGRSVVHSGVGHRRRFPEAVVTEFAQWFQELQPRGLAGAPTDYNWDEPSRSVTCQLRRGQTAGLQTRPGRQPSGGPVSSPSHRRPCAA